MATLVSSFSDVKSKFKLDWSVPWSVRIIVSEDEVGLKMWGGGGEAV
jgi:hypothetical protein